MDSRHAGSGIRNREAVEETTLVVVGTIVEPGVASPGPPGAIHMDDALVQIEEVLSPGARRPTGRLKLSYTRQAYPTSAAEQALEPGRRYVLFCTERGGGLFALKAEPHDQESVRVVASLFQQGTQHRRDDDSQIA